jgi:UDP-N-acetylglucosamine 4,6-dehydratase/UDP-glucose 4-epimerase
MNIVKGKYYLVTGGSGFLGVKLIGRIISKGGYVRTIARNEGKLIMLKEQFKDKLEIYFGDISDEFTVRQFMEGKFEGVFHMAAFKHVTLAESFSIECINSNVVGSLNVLRIGSEKNLKFIIGISSDKAAQMTGVYGASKYLMEKLFQQYEHVYPNIEYRIVRYGNVLYSTGSVLCKWKELIRKGKEIIVTDREATRFFWTVDQAVDLIFNCLENGKDANPFVPEMKSMSIGDLLDSMILKYAPEGVRILVKEIGLQEGENLHERVTEHGKYSNEVERFTIPEIKELI